MTENEKLLLAGLYYAGPDSTVHDISPYLPTHLKTTGALSSRLCELRKDGYALSELRAGHDGRRVNFWTISDAGKTALGPLAEDTFPDIPADIPPAESIPESTEIQD
jgi:hypothetical protein